MSFRHHQRLYTRQTPDKLPLAIQTTSTFTFTFYINVQFQTAMLSRNSLRALRGLRLHPLYSIRASAATIPASTTTATNPPTSICAQSSFVTQVCSFSSTPLHRKGLRPESQDPTPPNPEPSNANGNSTHAAEATPMSDDQYREYSEHYLNTLLGQLENLQESGSDIEAEYSVCPHPPRRFKLLLFMPAPAYSCRKRDHR